MSASATHMSVEGVGSIVTSYIFLTNVCYILILALNLALASQLYKSGCCVIYFDLLCCVQDTRFKRVFRIGHRLGELYFLEPLHVVDVAASSIDFSSFCLSPSSSSLYL